MMNLFASFIRMVLSGGESGFPCEVAGFREKLDAGGGGLGERLWSFAADERRRAVFHLAEATEASVVVEELERVTLGVGQIHGRVTISEGGVEREAAFQDQPVASDRPRVGDAPRGGMRSQADFEHRGAADF